MHNLRLSRNLATQVGLSSYGIARFIVLAELADKVR